MITVKMIPVLIIVGLSIANFSVECSRHGEMKETKKHNAWTTLIAIVILYSMYYWAGLFDAFIK